MHSFLTTLVLSPPYNVITQPELVFYAFRMVSHVLSDAFHSMQDAVRELSAHVLQERGDIASDMHSRGTHVTNLRTQSQLAALTNASKGQSKPPGGTRPVARPLAKQPAAPPTAPLPGAATNPRPPAPPATGAATRTPAGPAPFGLQLSAPCNNFSRGVGCAFKPCPFGPAGHVSHP